MSIHCTKDTGDMRRKKGKPASKKKEAAKRFAIFTEKVIVNGN